jgi:deoxyribonuclease-4
MIAEDVRHRIGYCVDTCHLYSAGYDLRNRYDEVLEQLDRNARI